MVNRLVEISLRPLRTLVALLLLAPATVQAQDVVVFFHTDAIGSVRVVTDASGAVIARYDYLPFGERWDPQPNPDVRQFAGGERDAETGFDYFGARYYRPQSGLFTTGDPGHAGGDIFNPQSWNAYSYALNNPLRFIDPTGTCSQDAKGNYFDSDDAGTMVAPGPCRINKGALDAGVTEMVSVKPNPSTALESMQPFSWDDVLMHAANFSAGMGDSLTGRMIPFVNTSLTEYARTRMGTDVAVSTTSVSYGAGNLTGGTVGWTLVGSVSATAAAVTNGKAGALFGRGTQTVFNSSKIRFGWGWEGGATTGRDVIRLGIGTARGTNWWNHIRFWYP